MFRTDAETLAAEGAPGPEYGTGKFLYAGGHVAEEGLWALFRSPLQSEKVKVCLNFGYSIFVSIFLFV